MLLTIKMRSIYSKVNLLLIPSLVTAHICSLTKYVQWLLSAVLPPHCSVVWCNTNMYILNHLT